MKRYIGPISVILAVIFTVILSSLPRENHTESDYFKRVASQG